MTATSVQPLETFRNELPYPFCPGCGHRVVLDRLDEALARLEPDPRRMVIVTDIGCAGLSDQYFVANAFHGLHGRSITYATGIKLADPSLEVIVLMGDGGTGIGGTHLLNAARRNIGLTVVIMNNLNFGMTGGQHSTTTPEGALTATTPGGNLEHPLDLCATVGVNGAAYVYRGTQFDADLADRLVEAIRHPGFALLDVWELCTAYYARSNRFGRTAMQSLMTDAGLRPGLLYRRELPEYAAAYRQAHAADPPPSLPRGIGTEHAAGLSRPISVVVAGSAGGKVRSAARLVAEAAVSSGLWATQRDDYPVTVQSGHSVAELVLSPSEPPLLSVALPDMVVLLSEDGLRWVRPMLAGMGPGGLVVTLPALGGVEAGARVVTLDPAASGVRLAADGVALAMLVAGVSRLGLLPADALRKAADQGPRAAANLSAVGAGLALAAGAGW